MVRKISLILLVASFWFCTVAPTYAKPIPLNTESEARILIYPDLNEFGIEAVCYKSSARGRHLKVIRNNALVTFTTRGVRLALRSERRRLARAIILVRKKCRHQASSTFGENLSTRAPTSTGPGSSGNGSSSSGDDVESTHLGSGPAQWEEQMTHFGAIHCEALKSGNLNYDTSLLATYYDAAWVFFQIGDYTGDSYWYDCSRAARSVYRDNYVLPNNGGVPGYWNFSHGLTEDYLRNGDNASRQALVMLAQNAAFASDSTPLSSTEDAALSREVAYAIMAYLNAERAGEPRRARLGALVDQALGHLDQWFVYQNAEYVRPFMVALTAQALITYYRDTPDPRIIPALTRAADWIWDHAWLPNENAFMYTDRNVSSGGQEPAPDLNLLIAPFYGWLYHQTGEIRFKDRGDQIFAGGVENAYLLNGKQFNQNYRWSMRYIAWTHTTPLR